VIVRRGDTLWAIAQRFLPAGASEAEIARSCAEWFATNRAVIGDNPDLIVPAQRLRPPTKEHS
jgi:nucleoid-associated protein YgaU